MLHCASSLYTRELKVILLYQPFQNHTIPRKSPSTLPCSPLPLHRPTPFPQPLQKNNTPSPRTITLASLVKGEVLSPDKIRATTGRIATPYTRELKVILLYQPIQNRTIPPAFRNANIYMHDTLSNLHYPIRFS